jgi:uncharacterized zinc-type alcohol dehydrogenase-like protein
MENTENYKHSLYTHQADKTKADAVAWAFVNKDKFIEFPFTFPELGAKEIRANILFAGLCLSDSLHGRSKWGPSLYPLAPGHEIIAQVSKIGSEVKGFQVGDKVAFGTLRDICGACKYCKKNIGEPLCEGSGHPFTYGLFWGGYATQLQQPAEFFIKVPDGLDLEKSSPLLCAGITVYTPIKKYLRKDDVCAVFGVGGLGHLAVQFINKMGNDVYGVTTSLQKRDFIKSLGAKDVVVSTDEQSMKDNIGKFDFIIDTIPTTENFQKRFDLLAKDGTYVIVGVGDVESLTINISAFSLVLGERKLVGSLVGSRENIKEMLDFCQKNNVYPMVETFDFEDFPKALDRLENGKPVFRCVVKAEEYARKNHLFK